VGRAENQKTASDENGPDGFDFGALFFQGSLLGDN